MRILKHKRFSSWAKEEGVSDKALYAAVVELVEGLYEANLGAGLYKKRIAKQGQGKRGGHRTLIAFKRADRCIFVFGFAKNERSNIAANELNIFKRLSKDYLLATEEKIRKLIQQGELIEIKK